MDSIVCFFSWYGVFVFFSFFIRIRFRRLHLCLFLFIFMVCFCPRCNSVLLALTCFHSLHGANFYLARKFNCRLWANLITTEINKKVKQQQQQKTNLRNTFASWQIALKTRIYLCNGGLIEVNIWWTYSHNKMTTVHHKNQHFSSFCIFFSLFFGLCFVFSLSQVSDEMLMKWFTIKYVLLLSQPSFQCNKLILKPQF